MDLLVTNQASSQMETYFFFGIFYIQMLSGYFSRHLNLLSIEGSKFDKILNYVEKIFRLKDLFNEHYDQFKVFFYIFSGLLVVSTIYFFVLCSQIKKNTFYGIKHKVLNYIIKGFIYIFFTIILDFSVSNICFEKDPANNPHFANISCDIKDNIPITVISIVIFIYACFVNFFIQFFYIDSLYLSNSPYAKLSCNYEIFLGVNSIIYSILYIESKYLSKGVFLIYNLITSTFFFLFYVKRVIFYKYETNVFGGIFHILYCWTAYLFFALSFFTLKEKSVIYVFSSCIIVLLYFNIKNRLEDSILLTTPYYKILNPFHLLYYIKHIINKINKMDKDPEEKSLLNGILQMHAIECPNPNCLSKNRNKIYLPMTNEWSDRTKPVINDKVYLLHFIIVIMNYFINQNYYSTEMIINISLYYLEIIGNYCKSLYFFQKVKEMKLSYQERFSFNRLRISISKRLMSKFKQSNDSCTNLEELDITYYFRYADLSQKLFEEMTNDVTYSLDFWRSFKKAQDDPNQVIDFNNVFHLTDKIRLTKEKVERIWKRLFHIYSGVNDLFELYLTYTEQVNDDDLQKRNLEEIKRKNENSADFIQQNYYSVLFNKETGIIIANGDKGKEGTIEKVNKEIENIFKYKTEEIKGVNVSQLMPPLLAKEHNEFMKNYYETGAKKLLDKKDKKVFGKDKDNCIILLKVIVKLFPVLNNNVFFVSLILKENVDDIIFIDSKFNIQGMSSKLLRIFQIDNKNLFKENEIPFYLICKKFVNFYKIFLAKKQKNKPSPKFKASMNRIGEDSANSDIFAGSFNLGKFNGLLQHNNSSLNQTKIGKVLESGSHLNKESEFTGTNLSSSNKNQEGTAIEDETPNMEGNDNKKDDLVNENIEISENIELEYEIKIPRYIYDFSAYQSKKDKSFEVKQIIENEESNDSVINESNEDNESSLLVDSNNNINSNQKELIVPKAIPRPSINITNLGGKQGNLFTIQGKVNTLTMKTVNTVNSYGTPYSPAINVNGSRMINSSINLLNLFNKQSEEEKDFERKILRGKMLFENRQFIELEDFIDSSNKDSPMNEFKFNFTFDRFKCSNIVAYVVRCIDNKSEMGKSDSESFGEENDAAINKFRKEKNESLQYKYELFDKEKQQIINGYQNYINLSLGSEEFKKLLIKNKEKISMMSMIHGQKKEEIIDDENSSQTSQAGFNSELCKKNHIEEIRGNLLNNVSHFYTLKYIQIIISFIFIVTCVFIALFSVSIKNIKKDLLMASGMNIDIFETSFFITSLISSMISLRALIYFKMQNLPYDFNTFIQPEEAYFDYMKDNAFYLYNFSISIFGVMESNINKYISNSKSNFWDHEKVSYNYDKLNDTESFPIIINQILTDVNSILKHKLYSLDSDTLSSMTQKELKFINYMNYLVIENFYDNLFDGLMNKLREIPIQLKQYNKDSLKEIIIIVVIYFVVSFILNCIYGVLLYLTNQNMGEGLEKVTKIHVDKIEDTIKKIENFSSILQKYKNKESVIPNQDDIINKKDAKLETANTTEQTPMNTKKNNTNNSNYMSEPKKHKKLKMLTYSYFQLPAMVIIQCGFLIPLLLLAIYMINSTNKLIDVESYLFGKLIIAASNSVKVKCMMSGCLTTKELKYNDLVDISQVSYIVQSISIFPEVNAYYNSYFLLNACGTAFDAETEDYSLCLNDSLVISTNNTDSLLKLVEEYMNNLYKDSKLKQSSEDFDTKMLFNSSSFNQMELIFYKYIEPVSGRCGELFVVGLSSFLDQKLTVIWVLNTLLAVCIIILCVYLGIVFVRQLIHLLSVSRCILKIIPTVVIYSTQDLENLMEDKH